MPPATLTYTSRDSTITAMSKKGQTMSSQGIDIPAEDSRDEEPQAIGIFSFAIFHPLLTFGAFCICFIICALTSATKGINQSVSNAPMWGWLVWLSLLGVILSGVWLGKCIIKESGDE